MEKRVLIVDFNHQVHTLFHSPHRLSVRLTRDGEVIEKDTTIQNGAIKNIFRWSKHGVFPTAVCFDRPVLSRKAYFQAHFPNMRIGSGNEYKGNREKMSDLMFEAVSDCEQLLRLGGVSCFARKNYEADDLIYACIKEAKRVYPGMKIDVVTNDADLLPLVDETVSVFLRSKVSTYAVDKTIEKNHYIQVTPDNYQDVVQNLSAYRGFYLPYNTLLLHKLLRGDPSDQFGCKEISRMFPASKFNNMISEMIADGVDLEDTFRYSDSEYNVVYKADGSPFNGTVEEALHSPDKELLKKVVRFPDRLGDIVELLQKYSKINDEQVAKLCHVYMGMNLNQAFGLGSKDLNRNPAKVGYNGLPEIKEYSDVDLRRAVEAFKIRLPENV